MATTGQVAKGGINSFGDVTVFATGDCPPNSLTMGTDTTPVVTETYIARICNGHNATITGVSLLNGSAVAGNVTVAILDRNGALIAQSVSTAQAGIATMQDIPLAAPITLRGPGLHYIAVQFNNTSARFRTHAAGRFTAGKQTAQVYGTFTAFTSPNSFTAAQGPIATTY